PSFPKPLHRVRLTTGHLTEANASNLKSALFCKTENPKNGLPPVCVSDALGDLPPFLDHLNNPAYKGARALSRPLTYRRGRPTSYAALMRRWDRTLTSEMVFDHFCRGTHRDFETFGLMLPGDKYPRAVEIAEARYEKARRLCISG